MGDDIIFHHNVNNLTVEKIADSSLINTLTFGCAIAMNDKLNSLG